MPKKKVKSCDEFMREALGFIHGDEAEKLSKDSWNEQVQERYDTNRNLYSYRINDFKTSDLVGRNGNYFQLINSMNRFDKIIENMADTVQKAMGIAVRHFVFPEFEKCVKDGQIQEIKACMSELKENFEIQAEVSREFRSLAKASDRNISGDMKKVIANKCVDLHYGEVPQEDRLNTLNVLMSTFSDRNIFTGFDGKKRVNQTQPMSENPDFSPIMINDDTHVMLNQGIAERYGTTVYNPIKETMHGFETAMDEYDKVLTDEEKKLPFIEKYKVIASKTSTNAVEKEETINEEISLSDLFDENKQTTAMPKNKGTEKPLSMGGKGI